MVDPELAALRREVAALRGELAIYRTALGAPDADQMGDRLRRLRSDLDHALTGNTMAMLNITNLYENTVIGNDRAAVHDQQISALQAVAQAEVPLFQGDVATLRKQVAALQQATDVVDCQGGMTLNLQMLGAE